MCKNLILCVLLWEDLLHSLLKLGICPAFVFGVAEKIMLCSEYLYIGQQTKRILFENLFKPCQLRFAVSMGNFVSSIYNLKTVFRADLINFQICTLSNLRLASYLIFIDYQKPILHQIILLRLIIFDLARCQK